MVHLGEGVLGVDLGGPVGQGQLGVAAVEVGADEHLDPDLIRRVDEPEAAQQRDDPAESGGDVLLGGVEFRIVDLRYSAHDGLLTGTNRVDCWLSATVALPYP